MMPKVTLLFAALHALLLLALAVPIARHRHAHKIGIGDGGDKLLARRIRVHGNFIEHAPLALLMLALLELCGLPPPWVWTFGGALLLGRLLHAAGLSRPSSGQLHFAQAVGVKITAQASRASGAQAERER